MNQLRKVLSGAFLASTVATFFSTFILFWVTVVSIIASLTGLADIPLVDALGWIPYWLGSFVAGGASYAAYLLTSTK